MTMPAGYRERIKDMCAGRMVLTPTAPILNDDGSFLLTPSLWLYPMNEWEQVYKQVMALPSTSPVGRKMQHLFIAKAEEVALDAGGRVLLPAQLREYAKIDKQLVILGQGKKFEIWSETEWESVNGFDDNTLVTSEQLIEQINQVNF